MKDLIIILLILTCIALFIAWPIQISIKNNLRYKKQIEYIKNRQVSQQEKTNLLLQLKVVYESSFIYYHPTKDPIFGEL